MGNITAVEAKKEAAFEEIMRRKIHASLIDPRGDIPAEDVFARLRAFHGDQLKARKAD